MKFLTDEELSAQYHLTLESPILLVTFHPVTIESETNEWQLNELLAALDDVSVPVVFTGSNADTNGRLFQSKITEYVASRDDAHYVQNLGTRGYFSLMRRVSAMVGNSSSGLVEAASFELPVVNIGTRQEGRVRPANVIDVGESRSDITAGISRAMAPAFRRSLRGLSNPYGDGKAAERIVGVLNSVNLDQRLLKKSFQDWPIPGEQPTCMA